MQVVSVDILGPLPESEAGNSYVLVAGDQFIKWMEVCHPNQEAITVARKITDEMFCRFSPPEQLHSDQGRQFESDFIKHICKILNVQKTRTSPYHPQCDGLVERFNRTLLHMLATTTREHPKLRLRRRDTEGIHGVQHKCAGIHWLHTFLYDVWMTS